MGLSGQISISHLKSLTDTRIVAEPHFHIIHDMVWILVCLLGYEYGCHTQFPLVYDNRTQKPFPTSSNRYGIKIFVGYHSRFLLPWGIFSSMGWLSDVRCTCAQERMIISHCKSRMNNQIDSGHTPTCA